MSIPDDVYGSGGSEEQQSSRVVVDGSWKKTEKYSSTKGSVRASVHKGAAAEIRLHLGRTVHSDWRGNSEKSRASA